MFELGIKIFLSYLLGSISGSLVLGRLKGTDIRQMGSGNAGATNALRTIGLPFAIGVALIDVGKGMLAAGWISGLTWFGLSADVDPTWLTTGCGAAAVIGHVYPFWHQFRGGKGAATLIGAYCMIAPKVIVPTLLVFIAVVIVSGFVGLSTMVCVSSALFFVLFLYSGQLAYAVFAVLMAVLVIFAHRENIRRMLDGNENRVDRLQFWRKKNSSSHE